MAVQRMNLKQRLARLETAFLSAKPKVRVVFIVLKKGQSADEGILEHMQLNNCERPQKCVCFEIVDAHTKAADLAMR
jgi:hypothetical protein